MNSLRLFISIAAVLLPSLLYAATDVARDFDQLTAERDQAVATATERYQAALEGLLRRATAANDFDTVIRIQQALGGKPAAPKPAVQPLPGTKNDFLGQWKFFNHVDKHAALVALNADKTYSEGGNRIGSWEVVDKLLIITYDHMNGNQDRYKLPVTDNKLLGKNKAAQNLTLSRVTGQ